MSDNYPPGVTGNEYEIAGPDSEEEGECETCGVLVVKAYFQFTGWYECEYCGHELHWDTVDDMADYYFELAGNR